MFLFRALLLVFLVAGLSLASCTPPVTQEPGPPPPPAAQNWLPGYLAATQFDQVASPIVNQIDWELGVSFIPQVDGKMMSITVKIPDVHPGMKVTVWNRTSGANLRTELIDITSSGVEVTKIITPLNLVKDTEYLISFNTNDYYSNHRTGYLEVVHPFLVGDLSITGSAYRPTSLQEMPNFYATTYYSGNLTFSFQK